MPYVHEIVNRRVFASCKESLSFVNSGALIGLSVASKMQVIEIVSILSQTNSMRSFCEVFLD